MRTPLSLVDEVIVTNSELIKVLIQLGYRDESTDIKYRFVNDMYNSIVELPLRPLEEAVRKVDLDIYSYRLYMQGVTKQEENLTELSALWYGVTFTKSLRFRKCWKSTLYVF